MIKSDLGQHTLLFLGRVMGLMGAGAFPFPFPFPLSLSSGLFPLGDRIAGISNWLCEDDLSIYYNRRERERGQAVKGRRWDVGDGKKTHRPPRPLIMSENILDWLSCSILNYRKRQFSYLRNQETDMCRLNHQGNKSRLVYSISLPRLEVLKARGVVMTTDKKQSESSIRTRDKN